MNKKQASILRKLENEKKRRQITKHHIINKSSRDTFNVFQDGNTTTMNRLEHDNRHLTHENEHPLETLQNCKWFEQVMSDKAKELYDALCSMSVNEFYNPRFIR